jgi:cyclohexanone monooxygenase
LSQSTSGYYSGEGDLDKGLLVDGYGGGSLEFSKIIAEWLDDGRMKSLVLL